MRKLLFALPLLAGASWAGTTYYSGTQTEPAYERLLAQLNQMKPFSVVAEEYNAGFVKSTAITRVTVTPEDEDAVLFRLKHVIDHSPVGVDAAGTRIGANSVTTTLVLEDLPPEMQDALNGQEPLVLHTRINMSGATVNELDIASFAYSDDKASISFDGGHYEFVSDPAGKLSGKGQMNSLLIEGKHLARRVEIAPSPLQLDLQQHRPSLFTGSYSMSFPRISVQDESAGMNVEMQDVRLLFDSGIERETYQGHVTLSIGKLEAPIPVNSADWRFDMRGFSVDGLETYTRNMHALAESPADAENIGSSLIDAYKAIITPGIGITNQLNVRNDGGDIALTAAMDYTGDGSQNGTDNLVTVRDLVNALTAKINLDADVAAVDITPLGMMMGHPMASQYILTDGTKYTSELKVAELILDANGDPQSLEMMLGGMLDMPLDFLQ
ncbi:MAG: YdgA family protein [Gammaproteobacteria bacterium]|nr:YdgA family protein [Gammaproteobacteria bacterium]